MNFTSIKVAAATTALLAANLAWGAPVTVDTIANPGLLSPNYISVDFSPAFIGMVNATLTKVQALDSSVVNSTQRPNGRYLTLSVGAMGLQAITFENTTGAILSMRYGGGFQLFPDDDNFPMTGGSWSVSNLTLDLVNKNIHASIDGGYGVGKRDNFLLWNFDTVSGTTVVPVNSWLEYADGSGRSDLSNSPFDTRVSGLKVNSQGFNLWGQSMGYTQAGYDALATVTNFGAITTSAVPESGNCALFVAGMTMVGLATRRQRKNAP